ncbi:MAG: VOC family protein [Hyphomicrobiales bacterium]|nr:MAG: VOC family protein [Hyphomicrobiales bacterium]
MIRKIECVCVFTRDIAASATFYASLGLQQAWRIDRPGANGQVSLIGLKFPDATGCELVLSDNADVPLTEIELLCDDVRATYAELAGRDGISWIREPFATESGHVAVMEAPDGNVFVLVGA